MKICHKVLKNIELAEEGRLTMPSGKREMPATKARLPGPDSRQLAAES